MERAEQDSIQEISWLVDQSDARYKKDLQFYQRHNAGAIKAIYNKMQNVIISCSGTFPLVLRSYPIRNHQFENLNLS